MAKKNVGLEIPSFLNMDKPSIKEKENNNLNKKLKSNKKRKSNKKINKNKKRIGTTAKITLGIIALFGTVSLLLLSPLFNIYQINVENNEKFSTDEIKNIVQIPVRSKHV